MASAKRIRRGLEFKTDEIVAKVAKAKREALDQVALEMTVKLREVISKQVNPVTVPGSRRGTTKKVLIRSKPGEPPRRETGFLRKNVKVTREGSKLVTRAPQYGFWLDGGTRNIAARPWFIRNLHTTRARRKWFKRIRELQRKFMR